MDKETERKTSKYPNQPITLSPDPNTNTLISKIVDRDKQGMDKFGLTMRQAMLKNPIDCKKWLNESLEEAIDLSRYLIEAILSYEILVAEYQILVEENKKLKKEIKKLKEHNKMLYDHP
jgi:cell division protein FtsB|tara:strand:- start:202 stop:558 length:357 start_codon:yes stop_codon:yes gene_type:complete